MCSRDILVKEKFLEVGPYESLITIKRLGGSPPNTGTLGKTPHGHTYPVM
jgi:hypothetical protein